MACQREDLLIATTERGQLGKSTDLEICNHTLYEVVNTNVEFCFRFCDEVGFSPASGCCKGEGGFVLDALGHETQAAKKKSVGAGVLGKSKVEQSLRVFEVFFGEVVDENIRLLTIFKIILKLQFFRHVGFLQFSKLKLG